jgi:hypothetical protein
MTKKDVLTTTEKPILSAKKVDNNTFKIEYQDGTKAIKLHQTDVVTFVNGSKVILNSGGWRTSTTKDRINKYSPFQVSQNKGLWFVHANGQTYDYYDNMEFVNGIPSKIVESDTAKIDKVKKQISKFCSLITMDNLPVPSNGDCWFCLMRDKDGKTMGDLGHDTDHLISHMKEKYLVGSLLVNAMREKGYKDEGIRLHYGMKLHETFRSAVRRYLTKRLLPTIAAK